MSTSSSSPFAPVFLFDSTLPETPFRGIARERGCRLVDMSQPGATVHGGNPRAVIWDSNIPSVDRYYKGRSRFYSGKHIGVMVISSKDEKKGNIGGLPDPVDFLKWFFGDGSDVAYFNGITGNYRMQAAA